MNGYLGEFDVDLNDSPYKDYVEKDWAEYYITAYGGIDRAHHKTWVLDQVMRILKGSQVIVKQARWDDDGKLHSEYRVNISEPSEEYLAWVKEGEDEGYEWDEGIAP